MGILVRGAQLCLVKIDPVQVSMMTAITAEFQNLESDDFCHEVAKVAEEEHQKEVLEWELQQSAPKTSQQFHQYVI